MSEQSRLVVREPRFAPFRCICCEEWYEDFVKTYTGERQRALVRRCAPCRMRCPRAPFGHCRRSTP